MTDDIIEKFFEGIIDNVEDLRIIKLLSSEISEDEILSKLLEKGE